MAHRHRLYSPTLTPEQNEVLFGPTKINSHTYKVDVIFRGRINDVSGLVHSHLEMKKNLASVCDILNDVSLDDDVAFFKEGPKISSLENIACVSPRAPRANLPRVRAPSRPTLPRHVCLLCSNEQGHLCCGMAGITYGRTSSCCLHPARCMRSRSRWRQSNHLPCIVGSKQGQFQH